jgi:hypothetical protein
MSWYCLTGVDGNFYLCANCFRGYYRGSSERVKRFSNCSWLVCRDCSYKEMN